jgi:TolA-binding protein
MTGNRVEKLEQQVNELRATVSGLTDELVETKERLREMEEHVGPDLDNIIEGSANRRSPDAPADQRKVGEAVSGSESADEAKSDEAEPEEESAGSDDIIVA